MDFKDILVCINSALYPLASFVKDEYGFELFLIIIFDLFL